MATTTNYGWTTPDDTDLVKDGAAAIRTLGTSIDTTTKNLNPSTTLGDIEYRSSTANTNTRLPIGTTGQVLTVAGGVPTWATSDDANAIQNAIVDAKGDLIAATAADTPARLPVGTNGQILVADSAEATGMKWADPAGGGKVLQVVQGTNVNPSINTSSTMTDTGLSASITPSSASSKIYVAVQFSGTYVRNTGTSTDVAGAYSLVRGTTQLQNTSLGVEAFGSTSGKIMYGNIGFSYLDSPATTSSITYKTQSALYTGTSIITGGATTQIDSIVLMEIGA